MEFGQNNNTDFIWPYYYIIIKFNWLAMPYDKSYFIKKIFNSLIRNIN